MHVIIKNSVISWNPLKCPLLLGSNVMVHANDSSISFVLGSPLSLQNNLLAKSALMNLQKESVAKNKNCRKFEWISFIYTPFQSILTQPAVNWVFLHISTGPKCPLCTSHFPFHLQFPHKSCIVSKNVLCVLDLGSSCIKLPELYNISKENNYETT